jgi:glycosyltransferase involved in cell wall biosynthesis
MKIGILSPLYESCPPKLYGGTERVVDNLCKGLLELGHDVTLFASNDSNTRAKLVSIVPEALRLTTPTIERDLPYVVLQVAKVIEQIEDFDIIHNHIDFYPYPYIDRSPCPWLTTLHDRLDYPDLQMLYQYYQHLPLASISYAQRKPLAFCNWLGNVYHGLDTSLFEYSDKKGEYLVFLGRICENKGTHVAIEIAKKTGIPLKIAAKIGPDDRDFFESTIKHAIDGKHIEFLGEIKEDEKSEFLSNALALLMPINWPEPFGLVIIESYACGTPVIGRPFGSLPEIIEDGKTGFLRMTTDELIQAVHDVERLDRNYIRHFAEKNFSYQMMSKKYVDLYKALIIPHAKHSLAHCFISAK